MGKTTIIELDHDFIGMIEETSGWFGDSIRRYIHGGQIEVLERWGGFVKHVRTFDRNGKKDE